MNTASEAKSEIGRIDVEILVLTYNRAALIAATLESLLAQDHPAARICVLDNGSTDDTAQVVRSFAPRGVELVSRETNDPRAVWPELQAMACGKWTMLFHDDDLLHPHYLRDLAAAIVLEPLTTVVVSSMHAHRDPEHAAWGKICGSRYDALTGRKLAALIYGGFHMPFCSAVYRTDILKRGNFQLETYGKIGDRPFVIEAALSGKALVFRDPYVKYRVHAKQDSSDQATGPFLPEVLALQQYYRKHLGESLLDPEGRIFLRRNYRNLLREYIRLNQNTDTAISRDDFFQKAIAAEAASKRSLKLGKYYAAATQFPRKLESLLKLLVRNRRS